LDADGNICEQGSFDELVSSGGYVSSFSFQAVDWTYTPEFNPIPIGDESGFSDKKCVAESSGELEAEANRRTGDTTIYLYYVNAIGWPAAIVFIFCIGSFVVCYSFPSTLESRILLAYLY
jgi:hypothetical protein